MFPRFQWSLSRFLIAGAVLAAIGGLVGRNYFQSRRYRIAQTARNAVSAVGIWEVQRGRYELKHMVLHSTVGIVGKPMSALYGGSPNTTPARKGLSCIPAGIFFDGKRKDNGGFGEVWVYCRDDDSFREIALTQAVRDALKFEEIKNLPQTAVWREVFVPAVQKCSQGAGQAGNPP